MYTTFIHDYIWLQIFTNKNNLNVKLWLKESKILAFVTWLLWMSLSIESSGWIKWQPTLFLWQLWHYRDPWDLRFRIPCLHFGITWGILLLWHFCISQLYLINQEALKFISVKILTFRQSLRIDSLSIYAWIIGAFQCFGLVSWALLGQVFPSYKNDIYQFL